MKNITQHLFESKGWSIATNEGGQDLEWSYAKEFMWMNTDSQKIGFISEDDITEFKDVDIQSILDLEPGEMFDSDGGINLYVRIK